MHKDVYFKFHPKFLSFLINHTEYRTRPSKQIPVMEKAADGRPLLENLSMAI